MESDMFKRILVPTDGSKLAEEAANGAVALAKSVGASIVGFYAMPTYDETAYETVVISPGWIPEEEFNKLNDRAAKKYLGVIEKMAKAAGVRCESYTQSTAHPAVAIVEAARDKRCDLICMSSHGRGGLELIFLGSVTTKVLSMCDIPVLVHRGRTPKFRTKATTSKAGHKKYGPGGPVS
jgi:nucleotide-binding universal stress UspA family protein